MAEPDVIKEDATNKVWRGVIKAAVAHDCGMAESIAGPLAELIIQGIYKRLGGQRMYVPALTDHEGRAARIKAMFTGANHKECAKKEGISVRHVRRLLAQNK
jgi:Mor family transcriptional regulator